jgi:formylmethanofuran dehydrogenase subunit C
MSGWRFTLRQQPALRVDLRGVTPAVLAPLAEADAARVTVLHGNVRVPLGDLFQLVRLDSAEPTLEFDGDLARFDRVGRELDGGVLRVRGSVGRDAGALMTAGRIEIDGSAGDAAGCEMAGGQLRIGGDAGAFAGGARPGSMDGMRGGALVGRGNVGERAGDRMRRGLLLVHGNAGDCVASRMVAGTLAVAGGVGAHPGVMMRRGTLLLLAAQPDLGPGFVRSTHDIGVFAALLANSLAVHGGPFAQLAQRRLMRHAGDLAVDGRGEVLTCA